MPQHGSNLIAVFRHDKHFDIYIVNYPRTEVVSIFSQDRGSENNFPQNLPVKGKREKSGYNVWQWVYIHCSKKENVVPDGYSTGILNRAF